MLTKWRLNVAHPRCVPRIEPNLPPPANATVAAINIGFAPNQNERFMVEVPFSHMTIVSTSINQIHSSTNHPYIHPLDTLDTTALTAGNNTISLIEEVWTMDIPSNRLGRWPSASVFQSDQHWHSIDVHYIIHGIWRT